MVVDSQSKKVCELKEWLETNKVESIAEHAPSFSPGAIPGVLTAKEKTGLKALDEKVARLQPLIF